MEIVSIIFGVLGFIIAVTLLLRGYVKSKGKKE